MTINCDILQITEGTLDDKTPELVLLYSGKGDKRKKEEDQ